MRKQHDQYFTPAGMVKHLSNVKEIDLCSKYILEPFVGRGDLIPGIQEMFPSSEIRTNDLHPTEEFNPSNRLDASTKEYWDNIEFTSGVITNPPFSLANKIIPLMVESKNVHGFVAALLRLSFLEPTLERCDWLHANPPDYLISLPRISFDGKGTDTVNTAWFVWLKKPKEFGNIIIIPKQPRRKKNADIA